jgi:hypothetical protein
VGQTAVHFSVNKKGVEPKVEFFVALFPKLGVKSDVVQSRSREELNLDVVTDQKGRFDLKSDLAISPLHDVASRFIGGASVRSVHNECEETVIH